MTDRTMAEQFLSMGLDYTSDSFTAEEKASMLGWYAEKHDHGDLDLAPFARFMIEHDPAGYKRTRRHLLALVSDPGTSALPVAAGVLMYVHTYIVLGNGRGALYEIIAMRDLGATRDEIMETIGLAALAGGPHAINPLADVADRYLRDWNEHDPSRARIEWPAGWGPNVDAFRSGIDLASDELASGELELIQDWYLRMYGEVPAQVALLAAISPRAFKTQRARQEKAVTGALPAQVIPLLMLHLSAIRLWATPLRRSLQMARRLGVGRDHAVAALYWAAVYGGDVVMETAMHAGRDIIDGWASFAAQ